MMQIRSGQRFVFLIMRCTRQLLVQPQNDLLTVNLIRLSGQHKTDLQLPLPGIVRNEIKNQLARNSYLQTEIQALDSKVAEINELQEQKREIRDRMNVIQNLQGSRPIIVRVFDELVKTLPDGVYFQTLNRVGDSLNIVGVADSYGELTGLMRQLDASTWFTDPNLQIISAADGEGFSANAANRFTLDLALVTPSSQEDNELLQ